MIIKDITLKNFKSYGNAPQTLELNTEKGELCLISAGNGFGKSSLVSAFDYVLYGKAKGSKKKWSTLTTIPNRINGGDTLVTINARANNTDIKIERGMSPNILKLYENDIHNPKAGASSVNDKIEKYIGMDLDTFKSFISMSMDDFKNFMSLSTDEKQLLLDKLFNLETINILLDILKKMVSNNKKQIIKLESDVSNIDSSIRSIKQSIQNAIIKEKENKDKGIKEDIKSITESMNSKKDDFIALKEKLDKITSKQQEINANIQKDRTELSKQKNELSNIDKELRLYDMGKCPTCSTDFKTQHFNELRGVLSDKKSKQQEIIDEIEKTLKKFLLLKEKADKLYSETNSTFSELQYILKDSKSKVERLKKELESENKTTDSTESIKEFEKTLASFEVKQVDARESLDISKEKEMIYKELAKVLSDSGAKKAIIDGIIKPINYFIQRNVSKIGIPFSVELDGSFNATVKSLGVEIDQDTLSKGETKILNICILIAYLKMIRTKKSINVLFLDEVFSSIDLENIDLILNLLRDFANEYKINIFVVHHAVLKQEMFDRIIKINKDIFSTIEILEVN